MSTKRADSVYDDVYQAVDGEFRTARDIWRRVGRWSLASANRALREMAEAGTLERRTLPFLTGVRHEYRRLPEMAEAA